MDRFGAAVLALVVLAGCAGPLGPAGSDETGTAVLGTDRGVTVTDIVDGDTLRVTFADGTTDPVRLVGIDAPETRGGTHPGEFEGVPDTPAGRACLGEVGREATRFANRTALESSARLRFDPLTDRRDDYGRLLAHVFVDDHNLNYRLVARGLARVYDTDFARADRFAAARERARANRTGVWACHDPGPAPGTDLAVASIHADAAGDDRGNLGDEYVTFENRGDRPVDISGWTVSDEAGREYVFSAGTTLDPGEGLTLRTGSGVDDDGDLFWGFERPVWNNDGDTVIVRNASGTVVLERSY